ncbi:MAG: hypothetical protein HQL53_08575 [Magnetococcales bacterium]|nr:hypothetical protein [Magnetococcales bacterium]
MAVEMVVSEAAQELLSKATIPLHPAIIKMIRQVPESLLKRYFRSAHLDESILVDAPCGVRARMKEITERIERLDDDSVAKLTSVAERIMEMTDDIGEEAMHGMTRNRESFEAQENACARALWLLLEEPDAFKRAEEIRYADNYRLGRMWDGFLGPKNIQISKNDDHHQEFRDWIKTWFRTGQVKLELYERIRPNLESDDSRLIQVVVYREGLPKSFLEFDEGELAQRHRRPVYEFALTYEPETGIIEVIAPDRLGREETARAFAKTMLRHKIDNERVPLRYYDLSRLMEPYAFPTDPQDGIQSVTVMMMVLQPFEQKAEKLTYEVTRSATQNIYECLWARFQDKSPLTNGFRLQQVKLSVRFHPDGGVGRGKTIPVKLSMPNGCNLKSKSEKERLICEKYLPLWGLVKEV